MVFSDSSNGESRIDIVECQRLLKGFEFSQLFIHQLNWSLPKNQKRQSMKLEGFERKAIAQFEGVMIYEITGVQIPPAAMREEIYREISQVAAENLLIFLNGDRSQSLWYWVKKDGSRLSPRDHVYGKHEACDLLLSKIIPLYLSEKDLTSLSVFEIADRLAQGWDVERVTKKFFQEFQEQHQKFLGLIKQQGVSQESDARWYTSVLLNRLMFVYFLQRKGFLDGGNFEYLQDKLKASQALGEDQFYGEFLRDLFFEGFAKPAYKRSDLTNSLIGSIKYLNGGLFLPHQVEKTYPAMVLPDQAFENLFTLFASYSWNLNDTPGESEKEINPAVLGYIFEKYINQKEFGAYYTRPEITEYLCDRTINQVVLAKINGTTSGGLFSTINELLTNLTPPLCHELLGSLSEGGDGTKIGILPNLTLLDPACGSGAFLVAAMKSLIYIYERIFGRIEFLGDASLSEKVRKIKEDHRSLNYYIKKRIISDNLYGVDIMDEATEIAKLRLFLALVSAAESVDQLEPLPNIDFNIMAGNSLIGLIRVDDQEFDKLIDHKNPLLQILAANDYEQILKDKNQSIVLYKKHAFQSDAQRNPDHRSQEQSISELRNHIDKLNRDSQVKLNELLLKEFSGDLGIRYEEAQLTGKPKKRILNIADIEALEPFHWGYHFDAVFARGGFDIIIANPPWEVFQTDEKEFFQRYNKLIQKKKLDIKSWDKQREEYLKDTEIAKVWLDYCSNFSHVSQYFKKAEQYANQRSKMGGKSVARKVNLYFLFIEQCYNLLRDGGECGIVVPSGIYTDLGTKQLREMLFSETEITGLFCFENRKEIFEGVHRSFKFVILTFEKGGTTTSFPTRFMRHDVAELASFPSSEDIRLDVPLIRKLSPDSLSIMEFKEPIDIEIAKKMLQFPLLGEKIEDKWNLKLRQELNMTSDSHLFKPEPAPGRLPLYEGKIIHQFTHQFDLSKLRYWIDEAEGRKALLGRNRVDNGQKLDYQGYRLGFRSVGENTNNRNLISSISPTNSFAGNSLIITHEVNFNSKVLLFICALLNSFIVDYGIRLKISRNLNMFYIYQLPVPRLQEGDKWFAEIVDRAAKLICTTPEFDDLAQEVGLGSYQAGVTDPEERAELRAELDGIVAHLYGLTEIEFTHILSTFPIVDQQIKDAALKAYQNLNQPVAISAISTLIKQGENNLVEFKSTARWNLQEDKADKTMEQVILKSAAAFLNSHGGTLLIGVEDNGNILGLTSDYQTLRKKDSDGFMLFLSNDLFLKEFGKEYADLFDIKIEEINGLEVCQINIKPAPQPMYANITNKNGVTEECFFIRSANSALKLTTREAVQYIKTHF